jgi:hypothetical protein
MQENIQDWFELDEGDPGFQLLTEEEIAAVIIFFIYFDQHYLPSPLVFSFLLHLLGLSFTSLVWIIS